MNGARKLKWSAWHDGPYGLAIAGRAVVDGHTFEYGVVVSSDAEHRLQFGSMQRHVAMRVIRDQISRDTAS